MNNDYSFWNVQNNTIHDSLKSNIYAEKFADMKKISSYNGRKIHYTNEQTKTLPTKLNNLIHIAIFMFSQIIMVLTTDYGNNMVINYYLFEL
jgi:hypothetical protein